MLNQRWKQWIMGVVVVSAMLVPGVGFAASHQVVLRVDGLTCPFCVYGLEKKLMARMEVTSYDANLEKGEVYIGLAPDAVIGEDVIAEAVRDAGFTLRGIEWPQ